MSPYGIHNPALLPGYRTRCHGVAFALGPLLVVRRLKLRVVLPRDIGGDEHAVAQVARTSFRKFASTVERMTALPDSRVKSHECCELFALIKSPNILHLPNDTRCNEWPDARYGL